MPLAPMPSNWCRRLCFDPDAGIQVNQLEIDLVSE
jgi:hypothetical protein